MEARLCMAKNKKVAKVTRYTAAMPTQNFMLMEGKRRGNTIPTVALVNVRADVNA